MLHDVLIDPRTERVITSISQNQWQAKWVEILMMHLSPHDVWVKHPNWAYLKDGQHSIYHPIKGIIQVTIKNGRRLIRNHRAYWKQCVVPNFFSEEQWEFLCAYHKEQWRFDFVSATAEEIQARYRLFRADTALTDCLGTMPGDSTHRMDGWNWGIGDCSDFFAIRTNSRAFKGSVFSLGWLSSHTRKLVMDPSKVVLPKFTKVVSNGVPV